MRTAVLLRLRGHPGAGHARLGRPRPDRAQAARDGAGLAHDHAPRLRAHPHVGRPGPGCPDAAPGQHLGDSWLRSQYAVRPWVWPRPPLCRRVCSRGSSPTCARSGPRAAAGRPGAVVQPAPDARVRERAAADAAADVRDLRAGVRDAPALPAGRLRAGPGGQPLHHGLERVQLPLARRLDGRPDPAARRRPADHRRGLPPARPADHAAGVPSRAAARVHLDHGRGDGAGPGGMAARARGQPVHVDAPAGAAGGDAGAVRVRPGPRRTRPPHGRGLRGDARLLGQGLRGADAARPGLALAGDEPLAAGARPGHLRGDRAGGGRAASAATTSSRCCSTPRTRTARTCRTRSCATRS